MTITGRVGQLRAVASAATPGPWEHGCIPAIDRRSSRVYATTVRGEVAGHPWTSVLDADMDFADARFIATFDPETVLLLLDAVEELGRIADWPMEWSRLHDGAQSPQEVARDALGRLAEVGR